MSLVKEASEIWNNKVVMGARAKWNRLRTNFSALPSSYSFEWDQKRRPWHYNSDPRSKLEEFKTILREKTEEQIS